MHAAVIASQRVARIAPDDRLRQATQGRSDEDWIASSLTLLAMTAVVAGFRTQKKAGLQRARLKVLAT
jgi:hypothetical protein